MMRATPESPRMFDRDLFDVFSRTHPAIVPILYVPGAALPLIYGIVRQQVSVLAAAGLFSTGFISWTLTEYWLHRLVFHYPARGPIGARIHFYIHGVHHQWVKDKYRLVMPPAVSLTLYFLFAVLFHALFGPRWAWPFHSGFVAGYLAYDMTHYATHHLRPRTRWGQLLRKHHFLHHFKDDNQRFGVSTPVWDWVFGTIRQ
jgi:sterol desaturase/sphingolipid hydroxylase (fatty acid hydroxylase superfamily)